MDHFYGGYTDKLEEVLSSSLEEIRQTSIL